MATPAFRCRCDRDAMPWTQRRLGECPRCGGQPPQGFLDRVGAIAADCPVAYAGIGLPARVFSMTIDDALALARDEQMHGFSVFDASRGRRVDPAALLRAS